MQMNSEDRNIIMKHAQFLIDKKYEMTFDDNSVTYSNKKISFIFCYERYSEGSNAYIKFMNKNKLYNIGWIAFVRCDIRDTFENRLDYVLRMERYIKENYRDITNMRYCKESNKLIEKYIKEKTLKQNDILISHAGFLLEKGYEVIIKEYGILFTKGNISFIFSKVDVEIEFVDENERYSIEQMAFIRKNIKNTTDSHFDMMLAMLDYVHDNYNDIICIDYCRESKSLVEKYYDEIRERFH